MTTSTLITPEPAPAHPGTRSRGEPRPFDFRRQSKLSREHVRTLQIVQETFSRGFSTMLASHLRTVANVSIRSIEQHSYDEYVREIPNPTLLTLLSLAPLPGAAILQLPTDVAYCAVELMLGGKGYVEQPTRPFTDLELHLMRTVIDRALPDLRYAFEPVVVTEPRVMSQESNPQFAQIAAPTDMVIVVSYDIRVEATSGLATMCIPFSSLQSHLDALSATSLYASQSMGGAEQSRQRLSEHLTEVPVEVAARFRQLEMPAHAISGLAVGDVIALNHPIDEPLTLAVDGVPTFHARIGRRNRRLAVRVEGPADPAAPTERPTR
ncbi:MAG: flagellar motor switch protein FliM, partial [Ilumatobacteraceae bacterium]